VVLLYCQGKRPSAAQAPPPTRAPVWLADKVPECIKSGRAMVKSGSRAAGRYAAVPVPIANALRFRMGRISAMARGDTVAGPLLEWLATAIWTPRHGVSERPVLNWLARQTWTAWD
jgi:hypothetical protein